MSHANRRTFLMGTGALAAYAATAKVAHADEGRTVVIGLIGTGGMGTNHLRQLAARKDVRVAYVCDADAERLATAAKTVESLSGAAPQAVDDMRRVFDDKQVEAVWIATPDHWHAPAAILALGAGKHVYVEKPCCHNVREGRLMIEAVRRSGKRLQVGTQSRSTDCVREAIDRLRKGEIGEVLVAKTWNSQLRRSIGKSAESEPPAPLDFDLWLGPALKVAYRPNLLPGVWRWWHDFGCGDIGNDGVHDIDVACWGLGVETHPSRIACLGSKDFFDDDQQFPDTQYAVFDYPSKSGRPKQLIFEQRIWSPYVQEGYENGAAFYGTAGMLVIGHNVGWKLYGPRNKLLAERTGSADLAAHHQNFLDSIRDSEPRLNADIEIGHRSAALVHLANIAARVGRVLSFDPSSEQIAGDAEANKLLRRTYREHWAAPAMLSDVTMRNPEKDVMRWIIGFVVVVCGATLLCRVGDTRAAPAAAPGTASVSVVTDENYDQVKSHKGTWTEADVLDRLGQPDRYSMQSDGTLEMVWEDVNRVRIEFEQDKARFIWGEFSKASPSAVVSLDQFRRLRTGMSQKDTQAVFGVKGETYVGPRSVHGNVDPIEDLTVAEGTTLRVWQELRRLAVQFSDGKVSGHIWATF